MTSQWIGDAADLVRPSSAAAIEIDVEQRDLGAGRRQCAAVRAPRPDAPPVTIGGVSLGIHQCRSSIAITRADTGFA